MTLLEWLATAGGAALIVAVVRELFYTLLHPSAAMTLSLMLLRGLARFLRRRSRMTGPLGMALTAGMWAAGLTFGFALIYWPQLPEAFVFERGLDPAAEDGFLDALYLSGVALATLGFGDVVAETPALRLALVVEALLGFALLTASITWLLSVYPALARSRSLAASIGSMLDGDEDARLLPGDPPLVVALRLHQLADRIGAVRVDLIQFPESYFFEPPVQDLSLPSALLRLRRAMAPDRVPAEARAAARAVDVAIAGLVHRLAAGPFGRAVDDEESGLHALAGNR